MYLATNVRYSYIAELYILYEKAKLLIIYCARQM